MDSRFIDTNGFLYCGDESLLSHGEPQYVTNNGIKHNFSGPDEQDIYDSLTPLTNVSYETESPDDQDSDPVLKLINQILEEELEEKPSMFHDPLALRNTEKSLYELIGQEYPPSLQTSSSPVDQTSYGENVTSSSIGLSSGTDNQWTDDDSVENNSNNDSNDISVERSNLQGFSSDLPSDPVKAFDGNINIQESFLANTKALIQSTFDHEESVLLFMRGMEEAKKFLPGNNQLLIDQDKDRLFVECTNNRSSSKGRKHHCNSDEFERRSKQSAIHVEDLELSELMHKVLLFDDAKGEQETDCNNHNAEPSSVITEETLMTHRGKEKETSIDLKTLLISCAQSLSAGDRRTAYQLLIQIKEHSSPTGDLYQRLAHVFAAGLETRLGGTGSELPSLGAFFRKLTSVEKLRSYHVYLSAAPFKKLSIFFANEMIGLVASKATTLHIIDFGIVYGFQWPVLIQLLSKRANGPPKLRITGIENPRPGFRPAQTIEETGVRLTKYCEHFNVPFEYQAIASQEWDKVKVEDLNLKKGETLAVNCLFRFEKTLDDTVLIDSPREALLSLIRRLRPDIFVNAVTNGSYNAPFFVARFKEALFHYTALFDMLDSTLPRDDPHRVSFEQDFYGREVVNVVACENAERIERPETYKQWQVRYVRAGFKPLALDRGVMKKLKRKVEKGYHRDFSFDEDGNWMLQGWKGRVLCASSCWVPS